MTDPTRSSAPRPETETTTYHTDIEGQANTWFGHRNDWAQYCTFCLAEKEVVAKS